MESLSGQASKDAHNKIVWVARLRQNGNYSEEEIAEKAGFGSVEAMYVQLRNWNLAGLVPKEEEASSQQPKQRRARTGSQDESTELPRPVAAAALIEEAVDMRHRIIGDLDHYRLLLKNGRFINTHFYSDSVYFPRSLFTPAQWQELCESYGPDPNSRGFRGRANRRTTFRT
jgi:hypothetical protein